jgi:NmrA-like family
LNRTLGPAGAPDTARVINLVSLLILGVDHNRYDIVEAALARVKGSFKIRRKRMFLVTGITGKVGDATAKHLLVQGKKVRALVRNREKGAKWADQGVELVEGD